jgi:hypothetical protein
MPWSAPPTCCSASASSSSWAPRSAAPARPATAQPATPGTLTWTPAALFAVVLMTGLGAFFLIYVSAFVRPGPTAVFVPAPVDTPGRIQSELPVIITLASYLLTTALIMAPFLFTLSAARRPVRGIVTLLVAAAAWLPVVMIGLRPVTIAGAAGTTVAAVVVDLLLTRVPDTWLGRRLPAVTGGIAALLWTGQLVAFAVTDAIRWPVSLWLGAVVLSAAMAAGLALLSSWGAGALRCGGTPGRSRCSTPSALTAAPLPGQLRHPWWRPAVPGPVRGVRPGAARRRRLSPPQSVRGASGAPPG